MSKINFYKTALFLVTLFLLSGFSSGICGQQTIGEKSKNVFQTQADEIRLTALNRQSPENNSAVLPNETPATKTSSVPANKQTASPYVYPNKDERFKKYLHRTFGGYALLGDVGAAVVAQVFDEPEEWENNSKGFGRRLASAFGRSVITQTVIYGLDESFKLDSNYYKSGSKNIKARFRNAVLSTFTARKPNGKRVFGFPRITGIYTSAIIANQFWYPARYNYKDGFSSGTISLGTSVAVNFLREFF